MNSCGLIEEPATRPKGCRPEPLCLEAACVGYLPGHRVSIRRAIAEGILPSRNGSSGFLVVAEGVWESEVASSPYGGVCRVADRGSATPAGYRACCSRICHACND